MTGSVLTSSFVTTLLTIIIVAAGVVGTIFEVNKPVKILIVILIVLTGLGTFFQSYENNRDAAFLKGALTIILATTKETPGFDRAITSAVKSIGKQHEYKMVSQEGSTLYLLTPQGSTTRDITAVFLVQEELKGKLYLSYANDDDLKPIVEQAMFGTDAAGGVSAENATNSFLDDIGLLCDIVLGDELRNRHIDSAIVSKVDFQGSQVGCSSDEDPKFQLHLGADLMTRIKPMNYSERNGQAYSQLKDQASRLPK